MKKRGPAQPRLCVTQRRERGKAFAQCFGDVAPAMRVGGPTTGPDGRFETRGADPGGRVEWEIDLPGGGLLRGGPVPVPEGVPSLDLPPVELAPTFTVRGRIVDPEGVPFPRAVILAYHDAGDDGEAPSSGSDAPGLPTVAYDPTDSPVARDYADPRGRFLLTGLPAGHYRLSRSTGTPLGTIQATG